MSEIRKKILIVDDEEDLTWSITKRLSKDSDSLDVYSANSGQEALRMMAEQSMDLLVTDLRMPGISGMQLLNEIKVNYPETLVIVMTAHGSVEVIDALHRWGRAGYIEKPFDMNELRQLIFTFLDEKNKKNGKLEN